MFCSLSTVTACGLTLASIFLHVCRCTVPRTLPPPSKSAVGTFRRARWVGAVAWRCAQWGPTALVEPSCLVPAAASGRRLVRLTVCATQCVPQVCHCGDPETVLLWDCVCLIGSMRFIASARSGANTRDWVLLCAGSYCPGGTVTPLPCGNVTVYCPAGCATPLTVSPGYYSDGTSPAAKTAQVVCPTGSYCNGGVQYSCAAGTYRDQTGKWVLCQRSRAGFVGIVSTFGSRLRDACYEP